MPSYVKDPIRPGDGDRRHGTIGGYANHKCRCEMCRAANYRASLARRSRGLPADDPRHGKWTTYFNYGCTCQACRAASAAYYRGINERRRQVTKARTP